MSFSEKTIHSLEFDKICELLATYAPTEGSKSMARMLMPAEDLDTVILRQRRTTDAKRLCDAKGMPTFGGVRDVSESCERADKGAVLTPGELLSIAAVLRTSRTLIDYCHGNHLFDTVLDEIFDRLIPNRTLEDKITRSIISEELIADEASDTLANIRRQIRITNNKIKETLQKYVQGGSHSKPISRCGDEGPVPEFPKPGSDHYANFLLAVMGKEETRSPFSVAAPLSEVFCLGCIAQRLNRSVKFDTEAKRFVGDDEANALLKGSKGTPRQGWEEFYRV